MKIIFFFFFKKDLCWVVDKVDTGPKIVADDLLMIMERNLGTKLGFVITSSCLFVLLIVFGFNQIQSIHYKKLQF